MEKKAIVIHSGGMDSSICLAMAMRKYRKEEVLSMSFRYGQRHSLELKQAEKICRDWKVDHITLSIDCLQEITENALMDSSQAIVHPQDEAPNTLVTGRNGLMARLGAIHAQHLGAECIYMGVIEVDAGNSGYYDCSRPYMDLMQEILRLDLNDPIFEIRTPLVFMTKKETMEVGNKLRVLEYLLQETISCYQNIPHMGCEKCPSCKLRNIGLRHFLQENPDFNLPEAYKLVLTNSGQRKK